MAEDIKPNREKGNDLYEIAGNLSTEEIEALFSLFSTPRNELAPEEAEILDELLKLPISAIRYKGKEWKNTNGRENINTGFTGPQIA